MSSVKLVLKIDRFSSTNSFKVEKILSLAADDTGVAKSRVATANKFGIAFSCHARSSRQKNHP